MLAIIPALIISLATPRLQVDLPLVGQDKICPMPLFIWKMIRSDVLVVEGNINGVPARMLIDTGSRPLRIQPEFARKCGALDEQGQFTNKVVLSDQRNITQMMLPAQLINLDRFGATTTSGAESNIQKYDAIMGISVLQTMTVGVDAINQVVSAWVLPISDSDRQRWFENNLSLDSTNNWRWVPPQTDTDFEGRHFRNSLKKGLAIKTIRLKKVQSGAVQGQMSLNIVINNRNIEAIFDTGTTCTTVSRKDIKQLKIDPGFDYEAHGMSTNWIVGISMIESLKTAWSTDAYRPVMIMPDDAKFPNLLGFDSLRRAKTLISFPHETAYIYREEPVKDLDWIMNQYGLVLLSTTEGSKIFVLKGSIAELAGLKTGDLVLGVASLSRSARLKDPSTASKEELIEVFGKKILIRVKREGEEHTVELTLQKELT